MISDNNYACTLKYDGTFYPTLATKMLKLSPEEIRKVESSDQDSIDQYLEYVMRDHIRDYYLEDFQRMLSWMEKSEIQVASPEFQDCAELGLSVSNIVKCSNLTDKLAYLENRERRSKLDMQTIDRSRRKKIKLFHSIFNEGSWEKCPEYMKGLRIMVWIDRSPRDNPDDQSDKVEGGNDRNRYIIHISMRSTEDRAVRAINTMIKTIIERLISMKYVEKKVSELKVHRKSLKCRLTNTELIFATHNHHMFLVRDHMTQFIGYLYNKECQKYIDDYVLIYGKSNENGIIHLYPDLYNPDSKINKIIPILYRLFRGDSCKLE